MSSVREPNVVQTIKDKCLYKQISWNLLFVLWKLTGILSPRLPFVQIEDYSKNIRLKSLTFPVHIHFNEYHAAIHRLFIYFFSGRGAKQILFILSLSIL